MYRNHFKLRERPFTQSPGQRFFLPNAGVADAVTRLRHLLAARDAVAIITGGPGVGKSAIVEQALIMAGDDVVAARVDMRFAEAEELFPSLLLALGEPAAESTGTAQALHAVRRAISGCSERGQRIALVLDCAGLTSELAKQLLRLVNLAGEHGCQLNVILQGPHNLHQQVDLPALIQLRQRVGCRYRVRPLTIAETDRYIRHQIDAVGGNAGVTIAATVAAAVYCYVAGVPRLINTLMDTAFTDACLARIEQPDGSLIRRTAEQLGWRPLAPKPAEDAPPPTRTTPAKADALAQTSRRPALAPLRPVPAAPLRPVPVTMSTLAARAASLRHNDPVRLAPRRIDVPARPPVAMDAMDTGATGMLRLQDLDERFAEAVFGRAAEETAAGVREPGIDRG